MYLWCDIIISMMEPKISEDHKDQDINLLKECLPLLSNKQRAYLKGAAETLFYIQEGKIPPIEPEKEKLC